MKRGCDCKLAKLTRTAISSCTVGCTVQTVVRHNRSEEVLERKYYTTALLPADKQHQAAYYIAMAAEMFCHAFTIAGSQ